MPHLKVFFQKWPSKAKVTFERKLSGVSQALVTPWKDDRIFSDRIDL